MKLKLLYLILTLLVFTTFACKKGISADKEPRSKEVLKPVSSGKGKLVNLGPQVTEAVLQSGIFVTTDQGVGMVYSVVNGTPGRLLGFDISNGRLLVNLSLGNVNNSWSLTVSTDGWLYIAGAGSGTVAKHKPGSQIVENLGRALSGQSYVWELTAGKDGEIFGGTYPGARVFRYHPTNGFSDIGKGALIQGESYVRTIVYNPSNDKLYAGVGSVRANLVELDPRTGAKTEILPGEYKKAGFVYPLILTPNVNGGNRLFATVSGKTLVYNLNNSTAVEREITGTSSRAIIRSRLDGNVVYHSHSTTDLRTFDFSKPTQGSVKVGNTAKALAMTWGEDNNLHILNEDNKLIRFNPLTSKLISSVDLDIPGQPITIRLTALGPDGRIWTSGFPVGGNGAYDPKTGEIIHYAGLTQAESVVSDGDHIYFGNYPNAHLYAYDTKHAWDMTAANPKRVTIFPEQDRIFGAVSVPRHNSLFFGTVPKYGELGGILARYDKSDNRLVSYGKVMPDLSIVSLVYKDDIVYGGTSILGGIGIDPTHTEAKLFVWDVLTNQKIHETVPIPGKRQITSLIIGPDGNIWGVADDTLFIYDQKTKSVLSTHRLVTNYVSASWKNIELVLHSNGLVYGAGSRAFFSIDPDNNMKVTKLCDDASGISMDNEGQLYFSRGVDLWQYTPES